MSLLRPAVFFLFVCWVSSLKTVMIHWEFMSSLEQLMLLTDSSMVIQNIVNQALEREGETQCFSICDLQQQCKECGLPPPHSSDVKTYTIILRSVTDVEDVDVAAIAMQRALDKMFVEGSGGQVPLIEATTTMVPVSVLLSLTTSYPTIVQNNQQTLSVVNGLVGNTGSKCVKICEVIANVCYSCDTDQASQTTLEYNVLIQADVSTVSNYQTLSLRLTESVVMLFGSGSGIFTNTVPVLPREPYRMYAVFTITSTFEEMLGSNIHIGSLVSQVAQTSDLTCSQICSQETRVCSDCDDNTHQNSQLRNTFKILYSGITVASDLSTMAAEIETPLRFTFGEEDYLSGEFTRERPAIVPTNVPSTSAPGTPAPVGDEHVVVVTYDIQIEFLVLTTVANIVGLTQRTQTALGGSGGGATCIRVCEMLSTGTQYTPSANCFSCDGRDRVASGTEAKRWQVTINGTSKGFVEVADLDFAVRTYIVGMGGVLYHTTTSTPGVSPPPATSSSDDLSEAAIIGIVVGSVFASILLLSVIYCCACKTTTESSVKEMVAMTRKESV